MLADWPAPGLAAALRSPPLPLPLPLPSVGLTALALLPKLCPELYEPVRLSDRGIGSTTRLGSANADAGVEPADVDAEEGDVDPPAWWCW